MSTRRKKFIATMHIEPGGATIQDIFYSVGTRIQGTLPTETPCTIRVTAIVTTDPTPAETERHVSAIHFGPEQYRDDNDTPTAPTTTATATIPEIPAPTKITHMIPAQPGWWALFQTPEYRHSTAYRVVAWIARADPHQDPTALLAIKGWGILIPTADVKYLDGPGPFQTYSYFEPPRAPLYTG